MKTNKGGNKGQFVMDVKKSYRDFEGVLLSPPDKDNKVNKFHFENHVMKISLILFNRISFIFMNAENLQGVLSLFS